MSEVSQPTDKADNTYGKITDEAVAEVRRRLNRVYPIDEPFVRYVNGDSIRHAARAIGDMNPLWIDRAHGNASRYGRCVAPPALLYAVTWGAWDMRRGEGLPGVHGLHASDRWIYHRPLLDGDEVFQELRELLAERRRSKKKATRL